VGRFILAQGGWEEIEEERERRRRLTIQVRVEVWVEDPPLDESGR
jgi:hypothetical protein